MAWPSARRRRGLKKFNVEQGPYFCDDQVEYPPISPAFVLHRYSGSGHGQPQYAVGMVSNNLICSCGIEFMLRMGIRSSCCYKGKKREKTGDRGMKNVSFKGMKKSYT